MTDTIAKKFPEIKELNIAKNALSMAMMLGKRYILKQYAKTVYIYDKEITNENEDFFLNKDFANDIKKVIDEKEDVSETMSLIDYFKQILRSNKVDAKFKKHVWSQLQLFNVICDKTLTIIKKDNELLVKFNDE